MDTRHITPKPFTQLTDAELITEVHALAVRERSATAALIAAIAEIDLRRLYLGLGYSSMFAFCVARLHLSERAAYNRITAGRLAQKFPIVLTLLEDGSITLTTVMLLAAHLTTANHVDVLTAAIHKSKRDIERQVAALCPQPAVPTVIRRLPAPRAAESVTHSAVTASPAYAHPRSAPPVPHTQVPRR